MIGRTGAGDDPARRTTAMLDEVTAVERPSPDAARREARASPAASETLALDRVGRSFGPLVALHPLTLSVAAGEFLSILGPSGSGKTTTLNLIAGFDQPSAGTIRMDGKDVTRMPPHRRGVGMVFQNYALFPHLTVFENVAFPLRARGWESARIAREVPRALGLVQLEGAGERRPRELSGGQQQRVALARAIVYRPSLLLMDEPLGALDRKLRADMQFEIKRLHRELGTTIIYVTHDQDEALSMSDRIAVLNGGHLEQCAAPRELYARPATRFVAGFVGETNLLRARVRGEGDLAHIAALGIDLRLPRRAAPGAEVTVAMRPEHLVIGGARGVSARVEETLFLGDTVTFLLALEDGTRLRARAAADMPSIPRLGEVVALGANVAAATVFDDTLTHHDA
jgi:putative spermidine/putrescine transport system ATP-binding protein